MPMNTVLRWLVNVIVFILLDFFWLTILMKNSYQKALGLIADPAGGQITFKLLPGVLAQIIIVTGIFAVLLGVQKPTFSMVNFILWGAFVGFFIYATYDLTNFSFIKSWPLNITLVDILWGTFQGAITGFVFALLSKF